MKKANKKNSNIRKNKIETRFDKKELQKFKKNKKEEKAEKIDKLKKKLENK